MGGGNADRNHNVTVAQVYGGMDENAVWTHTEKMGTWTILDILFILFILEVCESCVCGGGHKTRATPL